MISYQAPLLTETLKPSIAFLFPPGAPQVFDGPPDRVAAVVKALERGNCPAKLNSAGVHRAGYGLGPFQAFIAALEGADWSFSKLRESPILELSYEAGLEAVAITARKNDEKAPIIGALLTPWMFRVGTIFAPYFLPLPIEIYLQYHFSKVGDQTRAILRDFIKMGNDLNAKKNHPFDLRLDALTALADLAFAKPWVSHHEKKEEAK